MTTNLLVRYGAIPEVARFSATTEEVWTRGQSVVVKTHRGTELGTVLEILGGSNNSSSNGINGTHHEVKTESISDLIGESHVLRAATSDDLLNFDNTKIDSHKDYDVWRRRIENWNLELELIDLEWTLDREMLILYVLNERGADCTKLSLLAAANGLGNILVQPVDSTGLVQMPASGGGCGSGGGGCGSCSPHNNHH
ncbi:MAG: hypothetical protein Tsb009_07200 [Planctomycetaceae bacterium]